MLKPSAVFQFLIISKPLEKFDAQKYAAQFVKEGHLRTDDTRNQKSKCSTLLDDSHDGSDSFVQNTKVDFRECVTQLRHIYLESFYPKHIPFTCSNRYSALMIIVNLK